MTSRNLLDLLGACDTLGYASSAAAQARSRRRPASVGAGAGAVASSAGAASPEGAGAVSRDCAEMLPSEGLQGRRGLA